MKIKCVDNYGCSYLTVGKVYDAGEINNVYPRAVVCITDDVGDMINIYIKDSGHGKFEVVEE